MVTRCVHEPVLSTTASEAVQRELEASSPIRPVVYNAGGNEDGVEVLGQRGMSICRVPKQRLTTPKDEINYDMKVGSMGM